MEGEGGKGKRRERGSAFLRLGKGEAKEKRGRGRGGEERRGEYNLGIVGKRGEKKGDFSFPGETEGGRRGKEE